MAIVSVSTELAAPAALVWQAAKTPHAFVHVAKGMLRFPAAERIDRPWQEGDRLAGWILLFGFVPFSIHHLRVASIDEASRTLVSEERGGPIRRWRHDVFVTVLDAGTCRYEDRIEIEAGPLTPLVTAFASVFYRYRQRRWRGLARLLAAVTGAS
jgi:hypothetical protein